MADYRVLLTRLLTGEPLEELPVTALRWTRVLDAPGSIEATVSLQQPPSVLSALSTLIPGALGQLGAVVERDGVILWGGVLWTWQADLSQGTGTLRGEGWHSYVRRRVLRRDLVYTQQDQTSVIAAGLIAQTQTPGQTPVITTDGVAPSGVLRDRTYAAADRHSIGQLVEDLAAVDGGFDWRYETVRSGDMYQARLVTSYPNTGRPTDLVFEVGKGVAAQTISVDATNLVTHVDEIGSGEGDTAPRVTVANARSLGVYPLLDDVESRTDVTLVSTLDSYARLRLARGQTPVTLPELTVNPAAEPVVGSYVEGDVVRVRGGYGLAALDGLYRITQIEGSLSRDGGEQARLTFATLDVFQPA